MTTIKLENTTQLSINEVKLCISKPHRYFYLNNFGNDIHVGINKSGLIRYRTIAAKKYSQEEANEICKYVNEELSLYGRLYDNALSTVICQIFKNAKRKAERHHTPNRTALTKESVYNIKKTAIGSVMNTIKLTEENTVDKVMFTICHGDNTTFRTVPKSIPGLVALLSCALQDYADSGVISEVGLIADVKQINLNCRREANTFAYNDDGDVIVGSNEAIYRLVAGIRHNQYVYGIQKICQGLASQCYPIRVVTDVSNKSELENIENVCKLIAKAVFKRVGNRILHGISLKAEIRKVISESVNNEIDIQGLTVLDAFNIYEFNSFSEIDICTEDECTPRRVDVTPVKEVTVLEPTTVANDPLSMIQEVLKSDIAQDNKLNIVCCLTGNLNLDKLPLISNVMVSNIPDNAKLNIVAKLSK